MNLQEQAIRYACQNRLLAYASYINRKYIIKEHHEKIADALMRVEKWELKKLMIFMPPRSGKSHLVSELFPSWYLGRNSDKFIINCSYSADLSNTFSRNARNIVASPEYEIIFDTRIASDSSAVNQWHTSIWGGYISAWVGWPITGKGWHILSTDDPFKNQEEADSEVYREKVWSWYQSTLRTRKMDDSCAEILTLTRWHDDDLAWRLLAQEDDWEIIIVPALDEEWQSYWPEKFSTEYFMKFKEEVWPRVWSALYMQTPQAEGWWLFKREYFKYYQNADITKMRRFTFVDPAISEKQTADYTAIVTIWVAGNDILILDIRHGRMTPKIIIDQIFDVVKQYNPECVWVEWVGYQKMLIQEIRNQMEVRNKSFTLRDINPSWWGEMVWKNARISSLLHTKYVTGRVWHPKRWAQELESELIAFPYSKHDDICDALASCVRLANTGGGMVVMK